MKKLPILLIFLGFAAHAEWQLVHTDASAARFFVDKDNLRIINGYRRAWILNDLGKSNGQGTESFRSVEEYDCDERQARVMQIHALSGPMATGNVVARRSGNGQWLKAEGETIDTRLMDAVCTLPLSPTPPAQ
jgi:hypothetical protein